MIFLNFFLKCCNIRLSTEFNVIKNILGDFWMIYFLYRESKFRSGNRARHRPVTHHHFRPCRSRTGES